MSGKNEKTPVYMVMLFVGNTYGVCGANFTKDIPAAVTQEVYNYIRRTHYHRFRTWTQETADISPEALAEQGIMMPPKIQMGGDVTTADIPRKSGTLNKPAEFLSRPKDLDDEVLDGADEKAPPVNPEDVAAAFGNPDDDPDNAVTVAAEEITESRRVGRRGGRR